MSQPIRWLREESKRWISQGLISPDQAQGILKLYPEPKSAVQWGTLIFAGIGATMLGLGVILLLAYNWDAVTKVEKLGFILGGVALFHGLGVALLRREDWFRQLGEASCLLGSMLFGAGIWLIAQIYHIEEHFPNGFLVWGLGALAMAWAIPSIAQGILAAVLFGIWACCEAWAFDGAIHWAPLLILGGVGALAWRQRSLVLLTVVLVMFGLSLAANAGGALALRVMLFSAVLFVAVSILVRRYRQFPQSSGIWAFFGWGGFLFCVYLLTFPKITEELLRGHRYYWNAPSPVVHDFWWSIYEWGPLSLALMAWAVVAWPWRPGGDKTRRDVSFEVWLIPLTAVVAQFLALIGLDDSEWKVASVFNLVFLAIAVSWMASGCRNGFLRLVLLGSVLFVALSVARYFDLFESLATRGAVFLLVGAMLVGEAVFFFRRKRSRLEAGDLDASASEGRKA
jgi:uncharacterized membrane protein